MKLQSLTFLLTFLLSFIEIYGQEYKGIRPLQSRCEDVEKLLGIKACKLPEVTYMSKDEDVEFFFSEERCGKKFQKRLNVENGTVLHISVKTKKSVPLESITEDLSTYQKSFSDFGVFYINRKKGIEFIAVGDHSVFQINYFTKSSDEEKVLCENDVSDKKPITLNNEQNTNALFNILLDKNNSLLCDANLNHFSNILKQKNNNKGFIIVYASKAVKNNEVKIWIKKLKRFFKNDVNLIKFIDGGFREKSSADLFVTPFDSNFFPKPMPTLKQIK